jgi:quercetin dioxygenase-like cupin family protein
MIPIIDLKNKMEKINGKHCSPIDIALLNNQVVRMSYINGEFHWHKHTSQDELFYILKGRLIIQLKGQNDITLSEGQMAVIPKGIEHCPKSIEPTYALLFEPFNLKTRGD